VALLRCGFFLKSCFLIGAIGQLSCRYFLES
jgi:hypothetical protein